MQKQLTTINAQIERLSRKRARNETDTECLLKMQTKITSLLQSPIRMILGDILNEVLSVVIFEYLDLGYCIQHETHFPNVIKECIGCMSMFPIYDKIICNLKALRTKICGDVIKIVDFHSDDVDVKYHLMKILREPSFYQMLSNALTEQLKSRKLQLCISGNVCRQFLIMKQKSTPRDQTIGPYRSLVFEFIHKPNYEMTYYKNKKTTHQVSKKKKKAVK